MTFRSLCLVSIFRILTATTQLFAQSKGSVNFVRDVQPIFQARCTSCHGSEVQMSELRLDQRHSALKGGKSGIPAIVSGKSSESLLIRYVSGIDPKMHSTIGARGGG